MKKNKTNREPLEFKAELREFPGALKVYADYLFKKKLGDNN